MKNLHKKRLLIIAAIALAAGLTIYRSSLISVISAVLHREGSSHGLFIPFLSAYFIWIKRDVIQKIEPAYDLLGLPLLAGGIFLPIINVGTYHLHFISLIVFCCRPGYSCSGQKLFQRNCVPDIIFNYNDSANRKCLSDTGRLFAACDIWRESLDYFST